MKRTIRKVRDFSFLIGILLLYSCSEMIVPTQVSSTDTMIIPQVEPSVTPTFSRLEIAQATMEAKSVTGTESGTIRMPDNSLVVKSPDGRNQVVFGLVDGVPYYSVSHGGTTVILPSKMGFTFLEAAPLNAGLTISDWTESSFDETWIQPWGEVKEIRDQHNQLRIRLSDGGPEPRELVVVFRVFNDGVGFRYEFPEQPNLRNFQIADEQTAFAMSGDHKSWWIPAYQENRYEYLYSQNPLSHLSRIARSGVHTPFTMETADGLFVSIHEAALMNYASMTLKANEQLILEADLVPWSDGVKVKGSTPSANPLAQHTNCGKCR